MAGSKKGVPSRSCLHGDGLCHANPLVAVVAALRCPPLRHAAAKVIGAQKLAAAAHASGLALHGNPGWSESGGRRPQSH